jgi:hypothetical protein
MARIKYIPLNKASKTFDFFVHMVRAIQYTYTIIGIHIYENNFKYLHLHSSCLKILLLSYEKIKHIVEVDENILAVFAVNSDEKTSDIFISPDAKIDTLFIEVVRAKLDFKFKTRDQVEEEEEKVNSRLKQIGKLLWDISEYDKIRVIRIYEVNCVIVVLAKSHTQPGDTADTVLGYLYESNEDEEEEQQESPPCLF